MTDRYEKDHLRFLKQQEQTLEQLYKAAIERIYRYVALTPFTPLAEGATFSLSQYPLLEAHINQELAILARQIDTVLVNGIKGSFERSQTKFGDLVSEQYFKRGQLPDNVRQIVYAPQEQALKAFQERRVNGLPLSDRVWKYTNQFKTEIEQNLYAGISEGRSAAQMARDQRDHLVHPDKLFRRVRDSNGKLQLSKAAKEFRPGSGVYRSSYKNALRLTVTETNAAYRKADIERYRKTPFINGYTINLSPSHPKFDQCDLLAGPYPLEFEWTAWHPFCLCFVLPIMPEVQEFLEYQEYLLRGEGDKFKFKNVVNEVPSNFTNYMAENRERLDGYKTPPYWFRDNKKLVTQ